MEKQPHAPVPPVQLAEPSVFNYVTPTKDFTVYWAKQNSEWDQGYFAPDKACEDTLDVLGDFEDAENRGAGGVPGRACICSCFDRSFLSGTFRCKKRPKTDRLLKWPAWTCCPPSNQAGRPSQYLVETDRIVEAILESLGFPSPPPEPLPPASCPNEVLSHPTGLVVFAGSTNAAKSTVAQAFALETIRRKLISIQIEGLRDNKTPHQLARSARLPHLVTYENPIEGWYIGDVNMAMPEPLLPPKAQEYDFCLTARESGKDVESLKQALSQARRQTPTCFYIGEIRDRCEWEDTLDFAGTGHLVVATTHAASLAETLARILRFADAKLPSDRRDVGGQILGCIHLRLAQVDAGQAIILPTVWANKSAALNSLVADGLSSVTPNGEFVLSRFQFLKEYLPEAVAAKAAARQSDIEELHRQ